MDDITIGVTENVNNISVTAQPNDQIIDIAVTETVETVLLDVSTTVQEVSVTATQNVIVENITVDYVSNENHIDINVTDASQDVTLNVTPTLIEINILRSGGEVNILQFDSLADFPTTGSSDYFYLAKDTNKLYRWTGSAYAEISATANAVWGQIIGTLSEQTDLQNALNLKAPINSPTFTGTVSGITKGMVGLGAVDNTSDLDKPISTATQTALNAKQPLDADLTSIAALSGTYGFLKKTNENSYSIDTNTYLTEITSSDVTDALGFTPENAANKGIANGYASLNGDGKVPSSQLPSYVDDVIEVANYGSLPSTGETGKIYITLDTNKIYRWTGSVYVEVSSSAAVWGAITGTLSNQTDLQSALDAKLNVTTAASTYYLASNPNGYTSNVGTVTSVAMTVPSAFSVSGSPITSSGTLAVTATGNTTQYIAGDGSLVTFPTMSTAGTLIREVRNTTGATLTKGTVVYISGATGNKPTVSKAIATGDSTSAQTFGLVQADIANNANGTVVCAGDITGIDTSALTEGAQLYLSSTTAGAYTTTKQYAPAHLVYIGIVTRAHPSLGQIEVNIQNGYELDELHNVAAQTPSNNDGLFYEASTDLWKNKSIATVLGYTPANGADYMALSGSQSISGDKTFTGAVINDGSLYLKQDSVYAHKVGYTEIFSSAGQIVSFNFGASGVISTFTFANTSNTSNYTFPNASGTVALLSDIPSSANFVTTTGNQSIAGQKTFTGFGLFETGVYIKQDGTLSAITGYNLVDGDSTGIFLSLPSLTSCVHLNLSNVTAQRDIYFPNSNGTLALTSDLHNAVTIGTANGLSLSTQVLSLGLASASTTGALSSTDWNTFNNKASTASLANYLPLSGGTISTTSSTDALRVSNGGSGYALYVQSNAYFQGNAGFQSLSANAIVKADGSNNLTSALAGTDYVVPSALSAYLPLSGGTLTGALGGTSASFSDNVTITANSGSSPLRFTSTAVSSKTGYLYADASNIGITDTLNGGVALDGIFFNSTTKQTSLFNNGNISLSITSAGNVGIGTTSPTELLEVKAANPIISINQTTQSNNSGIRFKTNDTQIGTITAQGGVGNMDINMGVSAGWGGFINFQTDTTTKMRLTSGGELLIAGTYNPYPSANRGNITLNGTGTNIISFTNNSTPKGYIYHDGTDLEILNVSGMLRFYTSNTERMRITSGGLVGIGTSAPLTALNQTLTVFGTGIFQTTQGAGNYNENMRLNRNTGNGYASLALGGAYNSSAGTGVGQWTLAATPVALSYRLDFDYNGATKGYIDPSSGAYVVLSDINKKKDFEDSSIGLNAIMGLKPKLFRMTEEGQSIKKQLGFVAQEVKDFIPQAYVETVDGFIGLQDRPIIAALTKAIQELKAELDTLKNK